MTTWHVYVGTFTTEFAAEIARLRNGSVDPWRGNAGGRAALQAGARVWPQGGGLAEGIELFRFDEATGDLEFDRTVADGIVSPQYLARHPLKPVLYAVEYARDCRLFAYDMLPDGSLALRSCVESGGQLATSVAVHPSGQHAYVAHWGDGALTAFPLDAEGGVLGVETITPGHPDGVKSRSYHHEVRTTPSGDAVLVADNGGDELVAYRADANGVVDPNPISRLRFPDGSGPRNVEIHPSGSAAYVVGEWDSVLYVLAAEGGVPTSIAASVSTLPPDYQGQSKASELRLHPDGGGLYVGNRVSECLTMFATGGDGGVELLGHASCLGNGPASLSLDPSGRHLLVGNVYSGGLAVFRIEDDRTLSPIGSPVPARAPRSLLFAEASCVPSH